MMHRLAGSDWEVQLSKTCMPSSMLVLGVTYTMRGPVHVNSVVLRFIMSSVLPFFGSMHFNELQIT